MSCTDRCHMFEKILLRLSVDSMFFHLNALLSKNCHCDFKYIYIFIFYANIVKHPNSMKQRNTQKEDIKKQNKLC